MLVARVRGRTYVHAETAGQLSDTATDGKEIRWISREEENRKHLEHTASTTLQEFHT